MLTGRPPFFAENNSSTFEKILERKPKTYEFHTKEATDLIGKLLTKNPFDRLSNAEEIMTHPFFKNIDWENMMLR